MTEAAQPSEFNEGLRLFDSPHLWTLFLCLLAIVCVPLIGRCLSLQNRRRAVWALVVFAIAQELVDYGNRASFRGLNLTQDLPLHICNYSLAIAAVGLATRNRFCFELAYLVGFTAGLQALLTPDLTDLYNLTEYIVYFIHHGLIILFALWNIVVDRMVTRHGAVWRTFLFLNLMILPVAVVNWLVDANYMYLSGKPNVDNPLVFGEWPWYIVNVEVIGLLLLIVANVPMLLLRRRNTR
ncbi:MAG: TIGR02206 family membrane protein [Verrucomicrobiota bacterium]|nr:TIGR02206 family membrane protein [Verrucomicrobiota bacterium]MDP6250550.1 TIGR02206 family membrane protein [Verrucomicrobiota bacterium]MDP7177576.1 TIGR02206 family membrane protein [Verrucomicrobiota bacterium]MDP7292503.1 TIGR02206 family membrane protein [Verrucomicrobiota bacterium]MDP7441792.1 TIGR02206 family membrane protein [Verrucomicrobiota bacterium]